MPLRVLLVDDDHRFRATACRMLVADGVEVVGQVDLGLDVPGAAAQCRPDVILLDINLPDIDGLEVARRLRTEQGGPVVILISTRDAAHSRPNSSTRSAGSASEQWNAMNPAAKDTLLGVLEREANDFLALTDETARWEAPTACSNWQARHGRAHDRRHRGLTSYGRVHAGTTHGDAAVADRFRSLFFQI